MLFIYMELALEVDKELKLLNLGSRNQGHGGPVGRACCFSLADSWGFNKHGCVWLSLRGAQWFPCIQTGSKIGTSKTEQLLYRRH